MIRNKSIWRSRVSRVHCRRFSSDGARAWVAASTDDFFGSRLGSIYTTFFFEMNCVIYIFGFATFKPSSWKLNHNIPSKLYVHRIKLLAMHAYMQCSLIHPAGLRGTLSIYFHSRHLVLHNLTLYNGFARMLGLCCMHVRISKAIIAAVEWDGNPSFD